MNVGSNNAFADFDHFGATQIHIFADFGNHVGQTFFKRLVNFRTLEVFHVAEFAVVHQGNQSGVFDIFLENFVFGNEVGFGVNLDHGAFVAFHGNRDQTFGGNAAGFLGGRGQAFFAQPVDGLFHVAVCFDQGFFAVKHSGAGRFS